jgi:DNA-binding LytR/AlgR family response regulator
MIKIAICDDESKMRVELHDYTLQLVHDYVDSVNISIFENGQQLLDHYPRDLDVLLLDIQLGDIDGISVAKEIRKFDTQVNIIFITSLPQFAVDGYKVRAFGYLLKPLSYPDFVMELQELLERVVDARESKLVIKSGTELIPLTISEIIYAETQGRKLLIHTDNGNYENTSSLASLEEALAPHRFVRCHTAFLINSDRVQKIMSTSLLLTTGEKIPISKHRRTQCVQELSRYWGGDL